MLFRQIELEVRKHMKSDITCIPKKAVVQSICKNKDIDLYLWLSRKRMCAELLLMLLAENLSLCVGLHSPARGWNNLSRQRKRQFNVPKPFVDRSLISKANSKKIKLLHK